MHESPFRFGIFDLLVVIVLGALEGFGFAAIFRDFSKESETNITIFGLVFGYAFSIGGGFLASRLWTERHIESMWRRLGLTIAVNLVLCAILIGLWTVILLVCR